MGRPVPEFTNALIKSSQMLGKTVNVWKYMSQYMFEIYLAINCCDVAFWKVFGVCGLELCFCEL